VPHRSFSPLPLALAALLAAGCATDYDLERQRPNARLSSSKPLPVLRQCILARLSTVGAPEVTEGERETRITVRTSGGYPAALVVLRPSTTGTIVVVRQTISYSLRRSIESCI
jgi:hypothetical protein